MKARGKVEGGQEGGQEGWESGGWTRIRCSPAGARAKVSEQLRGAHLFFWLPPSHCHDPTLPNSHLSQNLTPWWRLPISDLDIKDVIALETNTRVNPFRRQSSIDPILQETMFGTRRSGLMRDWPSKAPDNYDRKLKSLMEKGTEPKMETAKMLKPEEVLSCR